MAIPHCVHRWLRLPSRIALILGLGALTTAGASADAQANQTASGSTLIRGDGGKIYLSEDGRETELQLSATPQRDRLLQLLEEHGSAGVKLDHAPRLIMASGGGAGFSLRDVIRPFTEKSGPTTRDATPATKPLAPTKQQIEQRDRNSSSEKKD